ncbi:hypothetical protein [Variovorax sp.]|uniref:hypothetical protein n=1 Tax=Variovorax sp. TaxID=1871043 RepID=UPI003BA8A13B
MSSATLKAGPPATSHAFGPNLGEVEVARFCPHFRFTIFDLANGYLLLELPSCTQAPREGAEEYMVAEATRDGYRWLARMARMVSRAPAGGCEAAS